MDSIVDIQFYFNIVMVGMHIWVFEDEEEDIIVHISNHFDHHMSANYQFWAKNRFLEIMDGGPKFIKS